MTLGVRVAPKRLLYRFRIVLLQTVGAFEFIFYSHQNRFFWCIVHLTVIWSHVISAVFFAMYGYIMRWLHHAILSPQSERLGRN